MFFVKLPSRGYPNVRPVRTATIFFSISESIKINPRPRSPGLTYSYAPATSAADKCQSSSTQNTSHSTKTEPPNATYILDARAFAPGTWLVLLQSRLHRFARAMTHAIGSEFTPYVDLDIGLVACSTRARIRWCDGEAKKRKWKKWKLTVPDDLMTKNAFVHVGRVALSCVKGVTSR